MPNPPSIPSHNNVFGYEENEKGQLVRQTNAEKTYAGDKKDSVGPGNYEVAVMPKTTHGTVKWVPPSLPNQKIQTII
jgi:hypothetical protein